MVASLKLFSKGDQLKVKLANPNFSKIGDGPQVLLFSGIIPTADPEIPEGLSQFHDLERWTWLKFIFV